MTFWLLFKAALIYFILTIDQSRYDVISENCTLPAQHKTEDRYLVPKEPSGVAGDYNKAKRRVKIGLNFAEWPEAALQMNAYLATYLLDVCYVTFMR